MATIDDDKSNAQMRVEIFRYKEEIARLTIIKNEMEHQLVARDRRDDKSLIPRRLIFAGICSTVPIAPAASMLCQVRAQVRCRLICLWTRGDFLVNDLRIGNFSVMFSWGPAHAECFNRPYRMILDCPISEIGSDIRVNVTNLQTEPQVFNATAWCESDYEERIGGLRHVKPVPTMGSVPSDLEDG